MIYVQPGDTFTAITEAGAFATGLAGTVGVTIYDGDGDIVVARTAAGIVEIGTSTVYSKDDLVAPYPVDTYILDWDDGSGNHATEELRVSGATFPGISGPTFATPDNVAARLARPLTAAEGDQVDLLLYLATSTLVATLGKDDQWAADLDPIPGILRGYCIELVVRALSNPTGLQSDSETLGAYSYSRRFQTGADLGMSLTKNEELIIRRAVLGATSGSSTPRALPDRLIDLAENRDVDEVA